MEFITGFEKKEELTLTELLKPEMIGKRAVATGMVHSIRDMGEIEFVILRSRDGLLQTVVEKSTAAESLLELREGQAVRAEGIVKAEEREEDKDERDAYKCEKDAQNTGEFGALGQKGFEYLHCTIEYAPNQKGERCAMP